MRILFLHENQPCYLTESLFHGLRSVLGEDCVDVPRMSSMYTPLNPGVRAKLRGNGFTLYGLLQDSDKLEASRYAWRLELQKYDFIVISHIWWRSGLLWDLSQRVPLEKLVVIDGEDGARIFPYRWGMLQDNLHYLRLISRVKYFKREAVGGAECFGLEKILPRKMTAKWTLPKNVKTLAFAIPEEKIFRGNSVKEKLFTTHVVDPQLASSLGIKDKPQYPFETETEYYHDIQVSKFGVTTKRAGWDCLRHYEIAANGCIPCFRDLDQKSPTCAPLGLNTSNSIPYKSAEELLKRVNSITNQEYATLQSGVSKWISGQTTIARAKEFLGNL